MNVLHRHVNIHDPNHILSFWKVKSMILDNIIKDKVYIMYGIED